MNLISLLDKYENGKAFFNPKFNYVAFKDKDRGVRLHKVKNNSLRSDGFYGVKVDYKSLDESDEMFFKLISDDNWDWPASYIVTKDDPEYFKWGRNINSDYGYNLNEHFNSKDLEDMAKDIKSYLHDTHEKFINY